MKKRLLALLLCFAMVLPLVACTPDTPEATGPSIRPPEELDWLNISTESFDLPIVKEGTEKTLTIWYRTARRYGYPRGYDQEGNFSRRFQDQRQHRVPACIRGCNP